MSQTFEEANATYWAGKSDFKLLVEGGTKHLCYRCSHKKTCVPGSMCSPVVECNHYEESKEPEYVCEDVKDALKELEDKLNELLSKHHCGPGLNAVEDCKAALEEVKKNWQSGGELYE